MEEMITISKKHYDSLVEDSDMLGALDAAGVDNWEGYSHALSILGDMEDDEEGED